MGQINLIDFNKELLNRVKYTAFLWFLFSVPVFFVFDTPDMRILQEKYFQTSAMILASLFFGNIWLSLFFILNMVLFWIYGGVIGASQVLSIFVTGVIFACSRSFFLKHSFKPIAKALYVTAFLSIIMMVFQAFGMDLLMTPLDIKTGVQVQNYSVTEKSGLFFLPPFNAIFLTLVASLILFLGGRWRWLGLPLIYAAIDSRCSAAFLAWSFLIPFWVWWQNWGKFRRFKKVIFLVVAILSIGGMGFYSFKDYSGDKLTYISRLESWHMIFKHSMRKAWGWGPDSFRNYNSDKNFLFQSDGEFNPMFLEKVDANTEITRYYSANAGKWDERFKGKIPQSRNMWGEAHNDYLQLLFEGGILAILLLIMFLREILIRFRLSGKSDEVLALFACLVVYALVSTTQFPFHLARLSGIFGVILGAYWAKTDEFYLNKGVEIVN